MAKRHVKQTITHGYMRVYKNDNEPTDDPVKVYDTKKEALRGLLTGQTAISVEVITSTREKD